MSDIVEDRAVWLARNVLPHEPALRAWLGRWRTPGLDLDDIVQETYAVLAAKASVADIRNPRAYCFQTARSIVLMHLRQSRIVPIRAVEDIERMGAAADGPSPEQETSDREDLHRLAAAIADLPPPGREAMMLRLIEGLTQREVGERLGISENAAQKHMARSLHLLMDRFGRGGNSDPDASRVENEDRRSGHVQPRHQSED